MAGSGRSPRKHSAEWLGRAALAGFAMLLLTSGGGRLGAADTELVRYAVVGDAIPASLTGTAGDPASGRAIVGNRQLGLCLLCHSGPFPEDRLQGTLAPSLAGVGSRLSAGQLRLRVVDASRVNPKTIMPPYYRMRDLTRVAPPYAGKPILSAEEVEDVVAFLATLRE
jgi:L-cysteine S-thiosulfotransferase